jgi:hypothetical protein
VQLQQLLLLRVLRLDVASVRELHTISELHLVAVGEVRDVSEVIFNELVSQSCVYYYAVVYPYVESVVRQQEVPPRVRCQFLRLRRELVNRHDVLMPR